MTQLTIGLFGWPCGSHCGRHGPGPGRYRRDAPGESLSQLLDMQHTSWMHRKH